MKALKITAEDGRYAIIKEAEEDLRPYYQRGAIVMRFHLPDATPIDGPLWTPISVWGLTVNQLLEQAEAQKSTVEEI